MGWGRSVLRINEVGLTYTVSPEEKDLYNQIALGGVSPFPP